MKKSLFLLTLIFLSLGALAQPEVTKAYNANEDGDFEAAANYIEEAINNERAAKKEKTWRYRGNIYYNIVSSEDEALRDKFPDALKTAKDSYMKALEMGSSYEKEINTSLNALRIAAVNEGVTEFQEGNYEAAINNFKVSETITEHFGAVDSLAIYNAALANEKAGNLEEAIKGYQRSAEIEYNVPLVYMMIANLQRTQGDEEAAIATVQEARAKYPDDEALLREELNYYLQNQQFDQAEKRLEMAVEKNPEDKNLYYALGVVYDELEKPEKAAEAYNTALELDPEYFDANFNLGVMYYNQGVVLVQQANEIPPSEQKKYDAQMEKAKETFRKALPYLEKAHELEPEDVSTMRSLSAIYARINEDEKYNEIQEKLGQGTEE